MSNQRTPVVPHEVLRLRSQRVPADAIRPSLKRDARANAAWVAREGGRPRRRLLEYRLQSAIQL